MPALESKSAARQSFAYYLRTGRRLPETAFNAVAVPLETKFNPWHDPTNGRFTFAGAGRCFGGRTGGGSFGGGGATGSWPKPNSGSSPSRRNIAATTGARNSEAAAQANVALVIASQRLARQQDEGAEWRRVVRNGYEYRIDKAERTRRVSGTLTLNPAQPRSRISQAGAGGADRHPTDDGGHYIARRFNGPTEAFNHFAQNANFNRGGYRALEDRWAKATRGGKRVFVKITPRYQGSSQRPAAISVWFTIDGDSSQFEFPNSPKGKSHGKR